MIYGYARCSTNESKQDINRQIRELKEAGASEVVFEYEHGDAKVKKNLHMLLDTATAGDTIITLEVSRLSRSTQQLCEIIDGVEKGAANDCSHNYAIISPNMIGIKIVLNSHPNVLRIFNRLLRRGESSVNSTVG